MMQLCLDRRRHIPEQDLADAGVVEPDTVRQVRHPGTARRLGDQGCLLDVNIDQPCQQCRRCLRAEHGEGAGQP